MGPTIGIVGDQFDMLTEPVYHLILFVIAYHVGTRAIQLIRTIIRTASDEE